MPNNDPALIQFLGQLAMCAPLTQREVDVFLDYCEPVDVKKGEVIADIGEVGQVLYFVVKGEAGLYHDDGSQEIELTRVKEGELMGEMSFFDRNPRQVRMRAVKGGTRLLRLTRPLYERLRIEHPYIAVNLLEYAIVSLDHMFRRVSDNMANYSRYLFSPGKK